MIIGQTLSEIGDVLLLESRIAIPGNYIELTEYTDELIGVTSSRYFDKKFRVSNDGLVYTEWYDLNNSNISTIKGSVYNNVFYIQYRYKRKGSDNTGLLEVVSVDVGGNVAVIETKTEVIDKTIFAGLSVGNFLTAQLCSNLLQKLISNGIIPSYIIRDKNSADFNSFWATISCYLSMFVTYAEQFETMFFQRQLLMTYLEQFDINVRKHTELLDDLQEYSKKYIAEIQKRGTNLVFKRKNSKNLDNTINKVDGEIFRLFNLNEFNEFEYDIREKSRTGFIVNKTSPSYKGTYNNKYLNKGINKEAGFKNLDEFTFYGDVRPNGQGKYYVFQNSGIGFENFNLEDVSEYGFFVDTAFDYEIILEISKAYNDDVVFTFGCYTFDQYDNKYEFVSSENNRQFSNLFFEDYKYNFYRNETCLFRGIVFNYNQNETILPNSYYIKHLKFANKYSTKILPFVRVKSGSMIVHNLKVRPLKYNYSSCFLANSNIIDIFVNNKNTDNSITEIKNIIKNRLIPYNTNLFLNNNKIKY